MKRILFCLILPLTILLASAPPTTPSNIRVLLEKGVSEALLEVRGGYDITNPADGVRISSGSMGKRFLIRPYSLGIKWGEKFPGIYQICVAPRSKKTTILLNGIQYDGAIAIFTVKDKLNIVNVVDIESYLKSILNPQFPYPLENEVMASVAIAARTSAYFHVHKNKDSFWHIDAKEKGYQGSAMVVSNSTISTSIDATRHLILMHIRDGKRFPFEALWTEHSGGKTASLQSILRKDFNIPNVSINAPHAQLDRIDTKWVFSITKQKLASILDLNSIDSIDLFIDKVSGKTYAFRIKNEKGTTDFNFLDFQEKLGKENIQSNDLALSFKEDNVIFTGYGKGHGVGICLYSASSMAQHGADAVKILSKFYPNSRLVNLFPSSKIR